MRLRAPTKTKYSPQKPKIKLKANSSRSATPDVNDEDHEDEANSMKLSHAFFVVLILHLVLIGGIFGFNYIKARQIPSLTSSNKLIGLPSTTNRENSIISAETKNNVTSPPAVSNQEDIISPNTSDRSIIPQVTSRSAVKEEKLLQEKPQAPTTAASTLIPQGKPAEMGKSIGTSPQTLTNNSSSRHESINHPIKTQSVPSSQKIIHGAKGIIKNEEGQKIYVVAAGDNPYSIARRFKIHYVQLINFNQIQDPTKLQIGTKLKIPVKDQ